MSLIICVECGKMFSNKALACPICACPTEHILNLNKNTKQENDEKDFDTNISRDFIIENDVVVKYMGDGEHIKVPDGIRRIAKAAFRCCRSIKSIVLPQSVEYIDEQAFEDCLNLKEINIPPLVKNISVHTFRNCQALTSIFLPEGLKTIAAYAFSRCYNLDRFYLPSTIIYISKFAFSGCDPHNKIYYNGLCSDFEKLKREHAVLNGLYRVSCEDGVWDYLDKTKHPAAKIIECEDDFLERCCEMCGKPFIPTVEYVYKDCDEDDETENFYCSWTCFRKRDDECCPMCGKNFRISRDEHGDKIGPYDEEYDNYYCSWDCLDKALEDNQG